MKSYFVIIVLTLSLISCNNKLKDNKQFQNTIKEKKSNIKNNNFYIKLEKFIKENPLDYADEQIYLINFCLSEKNDTLVFFHKTFYTASYFVGFNFLEEKGWFFYENKNPIIIYDYKNNPIGKKLYNRDSLLNSFIDKKKTNRHTNMVNYISIQEFKLENNKLTNSNLNGTVLLGNKIFDCYNKQVKSIVTP